MLAFLIGVVAGLRSMTAPAAVSWAAHLGLLHLADTPLAFLGWQYTPYIFTLLALGELVADQLPSTPSRKSPLGFGGRLVSGALSGGAIGASGGSLVTGVVLGVIGAVVGTLGGYEARVRAAQAVGKDLPIALLEDAIAIGLAAWIVTR